MLSHFMEIAHFPADSEQNVDQAPSCYAHHLSLLKHLLVPLRRALLLEAQDRALKCVVALGSAESTANAWKLAFQRSSECVIMLLLQSVIIEAIV
jgi:hypothetical protein